MSEKYVVKSLVKAMRVLECFSTGQSRLGVSQIAKMLGMQKSVVYNLLNTFKECGYVNQDPETEKYYLGTKLLHMSYIVNQDMGLRDQFLPYMTRIADETHEICYFAILDGQEALYIESAYPKGQSRSRNILGERADLYCTGLGKAMLAYLPEEEQKEILSRPMKPYTPNTLCDSKALFEQMREIRQNGYSVDDMEHEYGIRCVAVPVFSSTGAVFGAVSISGPSMRFSSEMIENNAKLIKDIIEPLQRCF